MSLSYRMDNRCLKSFAKDIKRYTLIEGKWAKILSLHWKADVENFGVDNSGNILKNIKENTPDFKFIFPNKTIFVEIKTCPKYLKDFFTFKISSLNMCIKYNALIIVPKCDVFYSFKPKILEKMLLKYEHKIYWGFSPNDLSVRIPMEDIISFSKTRHCNITKWKKDVKKLINNDFYK